MSRRVVFVDYHSGTHRPYQGVLHEEANDEAIDARDVVNQLANAAGAKDGDEIEIEIRVTGRRPFGDRRIRWVKPHTYERETEPAAKERAKAKR